ncbi:unnamed protein product [Clonostachys byssicola]|uniref:Uncharacterized protein n=1 Tax=Clonostachys byssicola TaxID=160290 RepID=A0A9N9UQ50_9HYPO|nr:unnamed protein product [Clonostachys byssicola]
MSIGRAAEVDRPAGGPPQLASCAVLAVVCAVISLWSPSPVIQVPSIQAPDALILRSSPAPEEGPGIHSTRFTDQRHETDGVPLGGQVICTRQRITQDGCDMHYAANAHKPGTQPVRMWWEIGSQSPALTVAGKGPGQAAAGHSMKQCISRGTLAWRQLSHARMENGESVGFSAVPTSHPHASQPAID